MADKIKVEQMIKDNGLHILAGVKGAGAYVETEMICRPGMEFAGFFDYFESKRVVLIGSKEATFLSTLTSEVALFRVKKIFLEHPPAIIFSRNVKIPEYFLTYAEEFNIVVLKSDLRTTPTSSKIFDYLQAKLAPRTSVHGTLLDINGMGTLIIGKSGIGKSETALELVKRGHQLISDDLVEIYEKEPGNLIGTAPDILKRYLEIRGIGIVDIVYMFGAGAYRERKNVRLVVELEKWQEDKYYDRLGLETKKIKYFDTEISHIVLPVLPGRNVALLVDSAAMNEKLKYMGHFAAKEFTDSVDKAATGGGTDANE